MILCNGMLLYMFQKNLVVWKLPYMNIIYVKPKSVSEELSSVETFSPPYHVEPPPTVSEELSSVETGLETA